MFKSAFSTAVVGGDGFVDGGAFARSHNDLGSAASFARFANRAPVNTIGADASSGDIGFVRSLELAAKFADVAPAAAGADANIGDLRAVLARGEWIDGDAGGPSEISGAAVRRLVADYAFPNGVRIRNVRITGGLDLRDLDNNATGERTLLLEYCEFDAPIFLSNSHLSRLSLRGSCFDELFAVDVRIAHGVDLRETGPRAGGRLGQLAPANWAQANAVAEFAPEESATHEMCRVCLRGARIGGGVEASGGRFVGADDPDYPWAFDMRRAVIGGDVGFVDFATEDDGKCSPAVFLGGFTLNSSRIDGNLWAMGAVFWSEIGRAISLQSAVIAGLVSFAYNEDHECISAFRSMIDCLSVQVKRQLIFSQCRLLGAPALFSPDATVQEFVFRSAVLGEGLTLLACDAKAVDYVAVFLQDAGTGKIEIAWPAIPTGPRQTARTEIYAERMQAGGVAHFVGQNLYVDIDNATIAGSLSIHFHSESSKRSLSRKEAFEFNNVVSAIQVEVAGSVKLQGTGRPGLPAAYVLFDRAIIASGVDINLRDVGVVSMTDAIIGGAVSIDHLTLRRILQLARNGVFSLKNAKVGGALSCGGVEYADSEMPGWRAIRRRSRRLICYPGFLINDFLLTNDEGEKLLASTLTQGEFESAERSVVLNGDANAFHDLNKDGFLKLDTIERASEYLRLFSEFTWAFDAGEGRMSAFRVRENSEPADPPEIRALLDAANDARPSKAPINDQIALEIGSLPSPEETGLRVQKKNGDFRAQCIIQYQERYFLAIFRIHAGGMVEMLDDLPLGAGDDAFERVSRTHDYRPPCRAPLEDSAKGAFQPLAVLGADSEGGENIGRSKVFALRSSRPIQIDLSGASVESLDDGNGAAWIDALNDEGKAMKAARFDLDGFKYKRFGRPDENYDDGDRVTASDERDSFTRSAEAARGEGNITSSRLAWLDRQRVHWRTGALLTSSIVHRPQPYRQLINVLQEVGYTGAATEIAVRLAKLNQSVRIGDYRQNLKAMGLSWNRPLLELRKFLHALWGFFFGVFFRFGYSTPRSLATVIGAILLGTLAASYANDRGLLVVDFEPAAVTLAPDENGELAPTMTISGASKSSARCNGAVEFTSYAADLFVPIVEVQQAHRCTIRSRTNEDAARYPARSAILESPAASAGQFFAAAIKDPTLWIILKTLYTLIGWVVVSLSILTATGILRRQGLQDR